MIGCAIEVHRVLGPGLMEKAYDRSVAAEFKARGIAFRQQVPVTGSYKGEKLGNVYRVTYLRSLGLRQGFLLNFNMPRLIDGLVSVLLPERSSSLP